MDSTRFVKVGGYWINPAQVACVEQDGHDVLVTFGPDSYIIVPDLDAGEVVGVLA